ncbi:MAG TPA: NADPH:quinone oxidoreductase family protein [Acidimicrobiia bacterium]|nr:NADPH:quinone oxidoreductase family protein [Acidimicrobiia bacterium]
MQVWRVERHGEPLDALQLAEVDTLVPGAGELRLRVGAAAVGLPDVLMCRGTYPLTPPLPFVPGQEVCGVVDAVGAGVGVPIGTRVMAVTSFMDGRGGFAESTIAPSGTAYRVPDDMSDADAAAFRIGYSTAWIGLVRRGALAAGESLLVLGAAGGSGAAAVQLGRALGARVIAVAKGAERCAFCTRLGADVVIDRATESVTGSVLTATDGRGIDLVYDPVGGESAAEVARVLAPGGRLLAVGFASGAWAQPPTHDLVLRNASLVGVYAGGLSREESESDHEALLALAADGALAGTPTPVTFDRLPEAVESVAEGSAVGKVVVRVRDDRG